jgi:phosphatidylglycerophosphatase A
MGTWEFIVIVAVVLLLFGAKVFLNPPMEAPDRTSEEFMLWIAQGFGIGRIPIAPGTFGSVLGVLWFDLLLSTGRTWVLFSGTVAGLALSVWLCGFAERLLRQKDPGSVVLDEIAAMPVCFLAWVGLVLWKTRVLPGVDYFFSGDHWPLTLGVFAAFRFFDIVKPWPVRQSQRLTEGWGITVDDFLAAIYVNLAVLVVWLLVANR